MAEEKPVKAKTTKKTTAKKSETAKKAEAVKEVKEVKAEPEVKVEEPAVKEPEAEKTFTRSEVDAIVAEAIRAYAEKNKQTEVIQVQASVPMVKLRFQCECSDQNLIRFGENGKFGSITGKSGTFSVPKEAFGGEFRDALVQELLASRELIVLDGLTDEERELYGVSYKKGELLEDKVFKKITDLGDGIVELYDDLCETHKIMLARRYMEELGRHPKQVDRRIITALNEKSKQDYKNLPDDDPKKKGLFHQVLEEMNKQES